MLTKNNPQKKLIQDLKDSKKLYMSLRSIVQNDERLSTKVNQNLNDIDEFILYVDSLNREELKQLIRDGQ